jgi:hypothetical protein
MAANNRHWQGEEEFVAALHDLCGNSSAVVPTSKVIQLWHINPPYSVDFMHIINIGEACSDFGEQVCLRVQDGHL